MFGIYNYQLGFLQGLLRLILVFKRLLTLGRSKIHNGIN